MHTRVHTDRGFVMAEMRDIYRGVTTVIRADDRAEITDYSSSRTWFLFMLLTSADGSSELHVLQQLSSAQDLS